MIPSSLLSLSEILESLKQIDGRLLNEKTDELLFYFRYVETDSRNVKDSTLFVPLVGEFQDGHKYIQSAIEKGATIVFVSRDDEEIKNLVQKNEKTVFIYSKNTLTALQKIAETYVRKFPNLIRCSVTGSSGKTTTKELTASILSQKYNVIANVGNFNSETGLPLSVFNIRPEHELGLFEMGMNRENEIGEIAEVFKPNYGIITNIGTAHIGILGSRENIAKEKKKIFNYVDSNGAAIIPFADDFSDFLAEGVKGKIVKYGFDGEKIVNDRIKFISDDGLEGTRFSVDGVEIRLNLPGKYNFLDALGSVSLGLELGLTAEQIKNGVESVKLLGGRSEILKGKYIILKDCYNANPDSMEKAIEFASTVKTSGKKIFVIGDMLELGEKSSEEHRKIGNIIGKSDADMVIFVGDEVKHCVLGVAESIEYEDRYMFISKYDGRSEETIKMVAEKIKKVAQDGSFILLKGSRGIGLERILPLIEMQ